MINDRERALVFSEWGFIAVDLTMASVIAILPTTVAKQPTSFVELSTCFAKLITFSTFHSSCQ